MNDSNLRKSGLSLRVRLGMAMVIFGLFVFTLGVQPSFFSMDRSPVVGFIQIAVFLVGLAMICIGGDMMLNSLWGGEEKRIENEIRFRLVAYGYVI